MCIIRNTALRFRVVEGVLLPIATPEGSQQLVFAINSSVRTYISCSWYETEDAQQTAKNSWYYASCCYTARVCALCDL